MKQDSIVVVTLALSFVVVMIALGTFTLIVKDRLDEVQKHTDDVDDRLRRIEEMAEDYGYGYLDRQ